MTEPSDVIEIADANQARASEPGASVWVSANAGTGKTAVLVRRFLRLLLAGASPESILCLTYTKTAAAEMQNRLLKTLSGWALMPEERLRETLATLLRKPFGDEDMRTARRLFARVLEARGGLKIHTIHGFCERLLQRFPLEATVTPNFTVLDETRAHQIRNEAFDAVAIEAASTPDSPLGHALAKVVGLTSEDQVREVVGEILSKRAELQRIVRRHMEDAPAADWPSLEIEALKGFFDVAGKDAAALIAEQVNVLSDDQLDAALAALAAFGGSAQREKTAEANLRAARNCSGSQRAAVFKAFFFTKSGGLRVHLYTTGFANAAREIADMLDKAKLTFARIETDLAHLRVVEASGAVLTFADAVQTAYDASKRREAALDYDDLIVKTLDLLSRSNAAAWVLYKIDGGIDHILVDEAQDTNPEQWSIVEALAAEFFAGASARPQPRTLFAVGDEKQSIYSFQGANPVRFGETGRRFSKAAREAQMTWLDVPLNVSFRSTVPVLEAVDRVFAQEDAARGLTFLEDTPIQHYAARQGQAGLVELWEVEETKSPVPSAPFEPWNEDESGADALEALCFRLAQQIEHWLNTDELLESQERPIRAGDILILVRRREPFTAPMIRALKRVGIPVAGADRMRLLEQLAVQDLMALADVLLMPEDDLALAVVLRSPLFGLDEDALFDLAYGREGSLWSALLAKDQDPRYAEAATELRTLLGQADMLPPFEFYTALLGENAMCMRKRMLARLGPEAAEAIDEFLDAALAYEREHAPSLQGFIAALREGDIDIKRDMEQDRDEVRIMTVHGAKGLQAPIVIMPDTCSVPRSQGPQIYLPPRAGGVPDDAPHLVWPPAGHAGVPGLGGAKSAVSEAAQEEYRRLLYVAMTRAEDRLYVCGWQGVQKRNDGCWYDLIDKGLRGYLTMAEDAEGRAIRRKFSPQGAEPRKSGTTAAQGAPAPLPDWAREPAPQERTGKKLSPSRLAQNATGSSPFGDEQPPLGPSALAEDMRFVRGRLIHSLLQHLPQVPEDERRRAAARFVSARGEMLSEEARAQIVSETLAIVGDSRFAPLFAENSLAEVPVVARIGDGETAFDLEGQIDRLAILEDGLLILDYKTNRPPPTREEDVAPAYIGQLAAYQLALRQMFSGKPVRAALLWTDGPHLMQISSTLLERAERDILRARGGLDAHEGRT